MPCLVETWSWCWISIGKRFPSKVGSANPFQMLRKSNSNLIAELPSFTLCFSSIFTLHPNLFLPNQTTGSRRQFSSTKSLPPNTEDFCLPNLSPSLSFDHPFPPTKLLFHPSSPDLLASSADFLRLHRLNSPASPPTVLNNSKSSEFCAPLTSFDGNDIDPNRIGTSSIDTTCTVWDLQKSAVETQLIAHDKEVYDIAWGEARVFASVSAGANGRRCSLLRDANVCRSKAGCLRGVEQMAEGGVIIAKGHFSKLIPNPIPFLIPTKHRKNISGFIFTFLPNMVFEIKIPILPISNPNPFPTSILIRPIPRTKRNLTAMESQTRLLENPRPSHVSWCHPEEGTIKLNTDGLAHGNPGKAGAGGILRDNHGRWIAGFMRNIGVTTSILAEL